MIGYSKIKHELVESPKTWLITGVAGFIGSNILEELLNLNQKVVGLDNFSTGYQENLDQIKTEINKKHWNNFTFIEGDICNLQDCDKALEGVQYVIHQAALGSVPRSIKTPLKSNNSNVTGFLNILNAAKDRKVESFTYASSSSVYGDQMDLPKVENKTGNPLSPYALTKAINEYYASVYSINYGFHSIGLRYFNVFGKRQNPNGEYAAVIPKWISSIASNENIIINGDGSTSRDFCFIENVVQMNILSALSNKECKNQVYNVAYGESTSLAELFSMIKEILQDLGMSYKLKPSHKDFRQGDIKHSLADISKARTKLNYAPQYDIKNGLIKAIPYYLEKEKKTK